MLPDLANVWSFNGMRRRKSWTKQSFRKCFVNKRRAPRLRRRESGALVVQGAGFFQEIVVTAGIGRDLAGVDVQDFGGELSDEMHVVGDEDEGAFVVLQREDQ